MSDLAGADIMNIMYGKQDGCCERSGQQREDI